MTITVEAQGKTFEFPDGTNSDQIGLSVDEFFSKQAPAKQVDTIPDISPAEGVGSAEALLIGLGKGFTDIGRGVGLLDPETPLEKQAFEQLEERRPVSTFVGEIAGQALPFVPIALGAELAVPALAAKSALGVGATQVARIGAQGLIGGTEGAIIAEGTDKDPLAAAGIGGTLAASIEAVSPIAGRAVAAIFRKVTGKAPTGALVTPEGQPTPELQAVLDEKQISFDDFTNEAVSELQTTAPVSAEEATRQAFLESQGLTGAAAPTQAQITRGADEFQAQQEAAKTSTRVRQVIEAQEGVLSSRFDNAIIDTLGQSTSDTAPVIDAVVTKATVLDKKIGDLYNQTREAASGAKNIRFESLASKLRAKAPSNEATQGAVKAITGDLQARGILDENMKVAGRIDVQAAEEARKFMNSLFDPQIPFRNQVIRELKESLDNDVFRSAGDDIFNQARKAKADFETGLSRAGVSKFDKRKTNLVRDLLEDKVNPDRFIDEVVKSKKYRASDLNQLKQYTQKEFPQAWQDLRAETLQTIKDGSFKGPKDAEERQALTRAALESELKKIGTQKLNVIFEPREIQFLKDLSKVTELREPVRGTALGKGPSAQAIAKLEKTLKDIPILGQLVDFIDVDVAGRAVVKAKPRQIEREVGELQRGLTTGAAALAAPVAISQQNQ
jgi:hypothetical protein